MEARDFAVALVEAMLQRAEALGMADDPPSALTNALYDAVALRLGWFRARSVDHALAEALPARPEGLSVACVTPRPSRLAAGAPALLDLACGVAARDAQGAVFTAVGSHREGVIVSVGAGEPLRVQPRARPASPHPGGFEGARAREAARALGVCGGALAVLRGRLRHVEVPLARWPDAAAWRGERPENHEAVILGELARHGGLAVQSELGEARWEHVSTALVARDDEALAGALLGRDVTRALPGEPCPRCGDVLLDPERGTLRPPTRSERDDDTVLWWVSGVSPRCDRCGVSYRTAHLREVTWTGETVGYRRGGAR